MFDKVERILDGERFMNLGYRPQRLDRALENAEDGHDNVTTLNQHVVGPCQQPCHVESHHDGQSQSPPPFSHNYSTPPLTAQSFGAAAQNIFNFAATPQVSYDGSMGVSKHYQQQYYQQQQQQPQQSQHQTPLNIQIYMTANDGATLLGCGSSSGADPNAGQPHYRNGARYVCCGHHVEKLSRIVAYVEICLNILIPTIYTIVRSTTRASPFSPILGPLIAVVANTICGLIVSVGVLIGLRRRTATALLPYLIFKGFQISAVGIALILSLLGLLGFTALITLVAATSGNEDYSPPEDILANLKFVHASLPSAAIDFPAMDNNHLASNFSDGFPTSASITAAYPILAEDWDMDASSLQAISQQSQVLPDFLHESAGVSASDSAEAAQSAVDSISIIFALLLIALMVVLTCLISAFAIVYKAYHYLKEATSGPDCDTDYRIDGVGMPLEVGSGTSYPQHGAPGSAGPIIAYSAIPGMSTGPTIIIHAPPPPPSSSGAASLLESSSCHCAEDDTACCARCQQRQHDGPPPYEEEWEPDPKRPLQPI